MLKYKSIFAEISSILKAELLCVESLQATAVDIEQLAERGLFEQIQERLFSRNQILETMNKLDEKLTKLVNIHRDELDSNEWVLIRKLGLEINGLLNSILSTGRGFQQNVKSLCDDISKKIIEYSQGRKGLEGYYREDRKTIRGRG